MVSEEFAAQHTQWSLVSTTYEVPVTASKRLGKGEEVSEGTNRNSHRNNLFSFLKIQD